MSSPESQDQTTSFEGRFHQTTDFSNVQVPESEFADDNGLADPMLRSAILTYTSTGLATDSRHLLSLLVSARLLVPVVSFIDSQQDGVEKDSHMRSVELHGPNGQKALLAFTGTDSVQMWNADARPIPQHAFLVARAAIEQDLDAIILDVAGPSPVALEGMLLNLLAIGPQRESLMNAELDRVCLAIADLPSVGSASWSINDETVVLTLTPRHFDDQFPEQLSAILNNSQLHALLDYPFEVTLSGQDS